MLFGAKRLWKLLGNALTQLFQIIAQRENNPAKTLWFCRSCVPHPGAQRLLKGVFDRVIEQGEFIGKMVIKRSPIDCCLLGDVLDGESLKIFRRQQLKKRLNKELSGPSDAWV